MFNILMYLPWGKVPETTCQELWQKREIVQIVDVRSAQVNRTGFVGDQAF